MIVLKSTKLMKFQSPEGDYFNFYSNTVIADEDIPEVSIPRRGLL